MTLRTWYFNGLLLLQPLQVVVVPPGVDLGTFTPGDRAAARSAVHVADDTILLLFVGHFGWRSRKTRSKMKA